MVHRSSILDGYVRGRIHLKQQEINQHSLNTNVKTVKYNDPVIDFVIRWSSTYKMLSRFIKLRSIVNDITHTPDKIAGLKSEQRLKLSKLAFSHSDWSCLTAVEYVLQPFEESTRLLSGRSYQTLAVGKIVMMGLKHFLSTYKSDEPMQKKMIVLKSKNKKSKLNDVSNLTLITWSLSNDVKKPLVVIESFLAHCEASACQHSSSNSTTYSFTIQQEIGYYISSIDKKTEFKYFWKTNEQILPQLANLVRIYCMMLITSVASESAFSVAGYVQRKNRSTPSPSTLRFSMLRRDYDI
ncbi:unnamed protein product [Rotaria sp. Silwood2]|nr:unnamed protein product [Rotaria sp. Silwood2]